ncbi:MAG: hypothetical protein AB1716_25640 [Planctomycetota bacterium]
MWRMRSLFAWAALVASIGGVGGCACAQRDREEAAASRDTILVGYEEPEPRAGEESFSPTDGGRGTGLEE